MHQAPLRRHQSGPQSPVIAAASARYRCKDRCREERAYREAVLAEIGRIARDVMNRVVRNMTTSLYIARRAG